MQLWTDPSCLSSSLAIRSASFFSFDRDGEVIGTARVLLMHPCVQDALKRLEGIVHPLVYSERRQWLQQHLDKGRHSVLVLDIPLLYETDAAGNVSPPPRP